MLPIVHNIWELDASELEGYFRDHPEPLVRALAERLEDSEAELEELRFADEQANRMEDRAQHFKDELHATEDRYAELLREYDKLARKLNEPKHSA